MRPYLPCLLALAAVSCDKPTSRPDGVDAGDFDRNAMLGAIGACVVGSYEAFEASATKLETALGALVATPTDATRKAARDAWLEAMDAWQVVELGQIGPLAATTQPGGQGLRDGFYAWPLLGRCLADEATASKSYEAPDFVTKGLPNTRGLGTLEYLLFFDAPDHGCGSSSIVVTSGSWAALTKEEIASRRAAYGLVLARDLAKNAHALVEAWKPGKGGFVTSLSTAGKGSAVYPDAKVALDAVLSGLFYVDYMTKDIKLGVPSGYIVDPVCTEPPCGELVEARWSVTSKRHVKTNLVAFRKLWKGCGAGDAGIAFDDYLRAAGGGALADELEGHLAGAIAAVDAFPYASIEEGLAKDPASVKTLIVAIKKLTDALKTDVVSILHLDLPARVAGDND